MDDLRKIIEAASGQPIAPHHRALIREIEERAAATGSSITIREAKGHVADAPTTKRFPHLRG